MSSSKKSLAFFAFVGATWLIGATVHAIHEHGRWSVIDEIYHKYNGWIVIPGETDEEGNWKEDED